jgi:parvulin-like peptidyl-prolyl isomerase
VLFRSSTLHAAIRGVLLQERLLEIAHQKGYDTLAVVLTAFRQAEDALFLRQRIEEITVARSVSDSEAQEYYRKNVQAFSSENELNVQEIIVRDRTLADSLRLAISQGADFASLARRFSARTWSAANSGVLGFAPVSRFGLLKDPLWNGSAGELIGPLQIEELFGLFRVLGKRDGRPRPFVDVREQLKRMVQLEEQRTTVREYLTRLQRRIGVEIDHERLASSEIRDLAMSNEGVWSSPPHER